MSKQQTRPGDTAESDIPADTGTAPEKSIADEADAGRGAGVTLAALVGGQVCLHSGMASLRMAAPLQALQNGYGAAAVGVLIGLFAAAAMLLALPAGKMADRYGSRRPALAAIGMSFAGGLIAALSQHYIALCAAALLSGAAANIGMISMQRSASRLARSPAQLRQVFGWLGVAPALSNFFGPFSAGLLIDHVGFRGAFAALALLPLLGLFAVRYLPREAPAKAVAPVSEAVQGEGGRSSTWALIASRPMRRLLLVNWLISASWDVHAFVLPILGYERGLSASAIGAILGGFAVSVGVVRVVLPMLIEHVSEARMLTVAMVLVAGVFCVYPLVGGAVAMGACSIALGLALGGSQPVILATLHQITPEGRHGESIALRSMTLNLSSTALPLLFGMVGAAIGAASLFWVMGAAIGAGSLSARRIDPRDKVL